MNRREFIGAAAGLALAPNLLAATQPSLGGGLTKGTVDAWVGLNKEEPILLKEATLHFFGHQSKQFPKFPKMTSNTVVCDLTFKTRKCEPTANDYSCFFTFNNAVMVERKKKPRSNGHFITKKRPMTFGDQEGIDSGVIIHPKMIVPFSMAIWVIGYPEVDFSFFGSVSRSYIDS